MSPIFAFDAAEALVGVLALLVVTTIPWIIVQGLKINRLKNQLDASHGVVAGLEKQLSERQEAFRSKLAESVREKDADIERKQQEIERLHKEIRGLKADVKHYEDGAQSSPLCGGDRTSPV